VLLEADSAHAYLFKRGTQHIVAHFAVGESKALTIASDAKAAKLVDAMGNQSEGVTQWNGSVSYHTWLDAADSPYSHVDIHQQGSLWVVDAGRESNPVGEVSWYGAAAYCSWAGRELPTEAQWEYAARGGLIGATYPWGDEDPSCTLGAQNGAQYDPCSPDDTIPVGSFAPNGYGLFDMAGNVSEWAADWYGPYSGAGVENPAGPASGDDRALRGGAWDSDEDNLRVSYRGWCDPTSYTFYTMGAAYRIDFGFRCASSP